MLRREIVILMIVIVVILAVWEPIRKGLVKIAVLLVNVGMNNRLNKRKYLIKCHCHNQCINKNNNQQV